MVHTVFGTGSVSCCLRLIDLLLEFVEFGVFRSISCSELIEGLLEGAALVPGDGEADTKLGNLGELGRGWGGLWGHIFDGVTGGGDIEKFLAGKEFFSLESGVRDWRLVEI